MKKKNNIFLACLMVALSMLSVVIVNSLLGGSYTEHSNRFTYKPTIGTFKQGPIDIGYEILSQYGDKTTLSALAPLIIASTWGELTIRHDGSTVVWKGDVRISSQGVEEWDWRKTGTHHKPGIQIEEIKSLLPHVDVLILTRGVQSVLQVPQETIECAVKAGKEVHVAETPVAIDLYNKLVLEGKRVGGVFHSTC